MNFIKYRYISFIISAVLLAAAIFSLAFFGLNPAIDFTGGALLELDFSQSIATNQIRDKAAGKAVVSQIQQTDTGSFLVRFEGGKNEKEQLLTSLSELEPHVQRFEMVGPTFGRALLRKAIVALLLAVGLILVYVTWRFGSWQFGIFAVVAMIHDNLILIGSFAALGHFLGVEVDSLFITAALTTLAASVHDTVVTFDYVRKQTTNFTQTNNIAEIANKALNDTVVRNLNNSWTIIFMLTAILLLGGETVRWFAAALLIGSILGTYSSTFLAVPLMVSWQKLKGRLSG